MGLEEEKNHSCAAKAVKQALHQLTHLQKIWLDILPTSVYCKAIGNFLNGYHFVPVPNAFINLHKVTERKSMAMVLLISAEGNLSIIIKAESRYCG